MRTLLCLFWCLCPSVAFGAVTISEVAWMGDTTSHNNEWIELYNDSDDAVSVAGWTLTDTNTLAITLAGSVPPRAYVLLERNRSSGVYLVNPPFLTYAGALVNTGTTLTLRDAGGQWMDVVADSSTTEGWDIGGDNTTKSTAQYTAAGWGTGVPTPAAQNRHDALTVTEGDEELVASTTPLHEEGETANTPKRTSGSASHSATVTAPLPRGPFVARIEAPTIAYVNQPVYFTASTSGLSETLTRSLSYLWNYGDLATGSGRVPVHAFRFPGTYAVILTAAHGERRAVARFDITVLPVLVSLARTVAGDISIHNNAPYDLNFSRYTLLVDGVPFTIPLLTIVPSKGTLTIRAVTVGATYTSTISLRDNLGSELAVWPLPSLMHPMPEPVTATLATVPAVATVVMPEPAVDIVTATPVAGPLVLLPPPEPPLPIPAYVWAALAAPAATSSALLAVPWQPYWPYAALVVLLLVVCGFLIASAGKMGSGTADLASAPALYTPLPDAGPPWLRPPR